MSTQLPDIAKKLLDEQVFVTVSTLNPDGGPELIQRLAQLYTGGPYTADEGTDNVRVVARVKAEKVITR